MQRTVWRVKRESSNFVVVYHRANTGISKAGCPPWTVYLVQNMLPTDTRSYIHDSGHRFTYKHKNIWEQHSVHNNHQLPWASYQIRNIAACACVGNTGNVFPCRRLQRKPLVSDPGMHHGTCVTHVPWFMSGPLTRGDGEIVPGIPGACVLGIWRTCIW